MTANMGKSDRILRLIAGLFLLMAPPVTYLTGTSMNPVYGHILVAFGPVLVVTAFIWFCPLNRLLNLSTNGGSRPPTL